MRDLSKVKLGVALPNVQDSYPSPFVDSFCQITKPSHPPSWVMAFESILDHAETGRIEELKEVLRHELRKERRRTAQTAWAELAHELGRRM